MADEFLESEVIFSDHHHHRNSPCNGEDRELVVVPHQQKQKQKQNSRAVLCGKKSMNRSNDKKTVANSVPVNIPERMLRCSEEEEAEDDDGEGMVPPHVMVERRIAGGKMAFSVCTGNGRTLKGRDLSRVRNSILRMTGFLEV